MTVTYAPGYGSLSAPKTPLAFSTCTGLRVVVVTKWYCPVSRACRALHPDRPRRNKTLARSAQKGGGHSAGPRDRPANGCLLAELYAREAGVVLVGDDPPQARKRG